MEPSLYLATVFNIAGIDQSLNPGALFTPTPGLMLVNQGGMGLGLNLGTGAGDIFFDFVGDTLGEAGDATLNPVSWGAEAAGFLVGKIEDYLTYNEQQYAEGTNGARGDDLIYEAFNAAFGVGEENIYDYRDYRDLIAKSIVINPSSTIAEWSSNKIESIYAAPIDSSLSERVRPGELYRNLGDFYNPDFSKGALLKNDDKITYYDYIDRYGDIAVGSATSSLATMGIISGVTLLGNIALAGSLTMIGIDSLGQNTSDAIIGSTVTVTDGTIGALKGNYLPVVGFAKVLYNLIQLDSKLPDPYNSQKEQ